VVDAGLGVWHITALGRGRMSTTIDSVPDVQFIVKDVKALDPSVKAVVGAHSWVNFSNEDISPQFGA
jgi:hypothetical protein